MVNDLIQVNGTTESFCDMTFVREIQRINHVDPDQMLVTKLPYFGDIRNSLTRMIYRHIKWSNGTNTQAIPKYAKSVVSLKISSLILNMNNFEYHATKIFNLKLKHITGPDKTYYLHNQTCYGSDLNRWFMYDLEHCVGLLPAKFVSTHTYIPEAVSMRWNETDQAQPKGKFVPGLPKIMVQSIKPQSISYLRQKYPGRRMSRMIQLFEQLCAGHDNNANFEQYIDDWAKRLLTGDDSK